MSSYRVRWKVGTEEFTETFRNSTQAESFRSALNVAARKGEAFSLADGLPISWAQAQKRKATWYGLALDYAETKWPDASPGHRKNIAEALSDATEVLIATDKGRPADKDLREALRCWTFSERIEASKPENPPAHLAPALAWLEKNTVPVSAFNPDGDGAATARRVLARFGKTQNGKPAAACTVTRKRMTLNNILEYARVEKKLIKGNPLADLPSATGKTLTVEVIDPRVVINEDQVDRFFRAVRALNPRLEAFFGSMYYAAMRPEECTALLRDEITSLPVGDWGEMFLSGAMPGNGSRWTDSGKARERRPLKHRPKGATRPVPIHPTLGEQYRHHIAEGWCQPGETGHFFIGPRGGLITEKSCLEVFHAARAQAFTAKEARSPLMSRPYDLRHAAVSTWLAAGVDPAQIAEWAGQSIKVLMEVYAKVIAGLRKDAQRRITDAERQRRQHRSA